jgi:hypothetical protein
MITVPPPDNVPVVHYRRGQREPIECGLRPILLNEGGVHADVTSERDAATCADCRQIARMADAAALACGCQNGWYHRGVARAWHWGGGLARVHPTESRDDD